MCYCSPFNLSQIFTDAHSLITETLFMLSNTGCLYDIQKQIANFLNTSSYAY